MSMTKDLTGRRFGRYVVQAKADKPRYWVCRCDCGAIKNVRQDHLLSGKVVSCGCYKDESFKKRIVKHGLCKSRIYKIYKHMRERCYVRTCHDYPDYGGRGIKICDEWMNSFAAFYNWSIKHGYSSKLSIDRINNGGNYSPENCRWATKYEQANNKRNNHYISFMGQRLTIAQWSRKTGITQDAIERRVNKYHWSIPRALTQPLSPICTERW